jgi:hypothetical protein
MSDDISVGDAPSTEPARPYSRRAALLTASAVSMLFVLWTAGGAYLLDHDLYAHVAAQRGRWPLLLFWSIVGPLALAGEVFLDIVTLKSWLERSLNAVALLLFIGFVAAVGIGVADERLPSDYQAVLIAIAFCCGSLSMTTLAWWVSLSPINPLYARDAPRKTAYIGDAIAPRRLDEMTGHGIPLLVATALLAVPPLAALALIAVNWQYASRVVFIYPAGFLTLCGAIILLFVVGVSAWKRGRKYDVVGRDRDVASA